MMGRHLVLFICIGAKGENSSSRQIDDADVQQALITLSII